MLFPSITFLGVVSALAAFLYKPLASENDFTAGSDAHSSRILILTAHPDDEAMFFAPTILALSQKYSTSVQATQADGTSPQHVLAVQPPSSEIFSLCLSVGNADGLGDIRREELNRSLDILGVAFDNRLIIDHPDLQDNITLDWDPVTISNVLLPYIIDHKISTILTFDYAGISSHPNHKALPRGAQLLLKNLPQRGSLPRPRLFTLISVPKLGKYTSILAPTLAKFDLYMSKALQQYELLIVRLLERFDVLQSNSSKPVKQSPLLPVFVSGLPEYHKSLTAMQAHKSQLVWYRLLYVSFSRYMWVNEWVELKL